MAEKGDSVRRLQETVARFVRERDWEKYHSPKNLSMALAVEAAELMEIFQWLSPVEAEALVRESAKASNVEEELADIVIYALSLANALGVDLGAAVMKKIERNKIKYPAKDARRIDYTK